VCDREQETENKRQRKPEGQGKREREKERGLSERTRKRNVKGLEKKIVCERNRTCKHLVIAVELLKTVMMNMAYFLLYKSKSTHQNQTGSRWIHRQPPELFLNLPIGQRVHTAASLER